MNFTLLRSHRFFSFGKQMLVDIYTVVQVNRKANNVSGASQTVWVTVLDLMT